MNVVGWLFGSCIPSGYSTPLANTNNLPTREEWEHWGKSLQNGLDSELGRHHFEKFLKKSKKESYYTFRFVVEVSELKQLTDKQEIDNKVLAMFVFYISKRNGGTRIPIDKGYNFLCATRDISVTTYDSTVEKVRGVLEREYQRFLASEDYREMMWREPEPSESSAALSVVSLTI